MPGKNKTPLLGWHPPAELSARIRAEAERQEKTLTALLNEMAERYLADRPSDTETNWDR